jgi:hypothetical protein
VGLAFDVYSAAAPNGALLATLTDAFDKQASFSLREMGAGTFSIPRSSAQATTAIIAQGNLVKVRLTELSATPIGAFWMEVGRFDLVGGDDGPEVLTFGGRGALAYVGRAIMWSTSYVGPLTVSPDGTWPLYLSGGWVSGPHQPGMMLLQILQETQQFSRPQQPLPDLTYDFNYANDSNGAAWATSSAVDEFTARVGDQLDDVIGSLLAAADTPIVQMGPNLDIHAYNAFGTIRTSTVFAAGKVRLAKGVNIATALSHEIGASRIKSHILASGDPGVWASASSALLPVREGYASSSGTSTAHLAALATSQIAIRARNADSVRTGVPYGNVPLSGIYLPGPAALGGHYWLGDSITLHTGTGAHDYNNSPQVVTEIAIGEDEDGTPVIEVALGSTYSGGQWANVSDRITDAAESSYVAKNEALRLARTMREVKVVSALPTLPDVAYPAGSIVYLTSNGLLYKTETGLVGSWITVVDAADMTGQITSGQIAANSIIAGKIAAGAVNASAIATGAIEVAGLSSIVAANMLDNPSFELGTPFVASVVPGWACNPAAGGTVQIRDSSGAAPYDGLQVLSIQNGASLNSFVRPQSYRPVAGGEVVYFSAMMKTAAGAAAALVRMEGHDATGAYFLSATIPLTTGTLGSTWTRHSTPITVPAGWVDFRILIYNIIANTWLWVDNVMLTRSQDLVHASGNTVIDQDGIAVSGGAIVVTNPAGTVVIDGSSDMFKIAATGTFTATAGASSSAAGAVSIGALTMATTPLVLGHVAWSSGGVADANPLAFLAPNVGWNASVLGGSTNQQAVSFSALAYIYGSLVSSHPVPTIVLYNNGSSVGHTAYGRYYVMLEAAL